MAVRAQLSWRRRWRERVRRGTLGLGRAAAGCGFAGMLAVFPIEPAAGSTLAAIEITSIPAYATNGSVTGAVTGVDFATHRVTAYIQIEGAGWWTKPTFENPTVGINPDGTFAINVTTGGLDNRATILCVALLAPGVDPPMAEGAPRIPATLVSLAVDCDERYARVLQFAGLTWAVKEAPLPVGPGPNRFSALPGDVFVDGDGLHLTISLHDGLWWSTEVILLESLGFGTYWFQTNSAVDDLDINATFGAFTWDPYGDDETVPNSPHREIDFEDSRWGAAADPTTSQTVVQPFDVEGNLHRYTLPDLGADPSLTRFFTWKPDRVEFTSLQGYHAPFSLPGASVIDQFTYVHDPASSHFVPTEGRESFRFNLWLNNGTSDPAGGQPVGVVIKDFHFRALDCRLDVDGNGEVDVATDIVYIARALLGLPPVPASFRALDASIAPDAIIQGRIDACLP